MALTHSSYANEVKHQIKYNERQEFLGDAVLSIIVSDYLFNNYTVPEGELTKLRAAIVCESRWTSWLTRSAWGNTCAGPRGGIDRRQNRPSIIADAFEALIAAIYLDSGIESARKFVLPFVTEMLEHEDSLSFKDYKTILQEIIQQKPEEKLVYKLVGEKGPDHDKRFLVDVMLNSNVIGRGEGRSKKNAEQMAAQEALELMGK